MSYYVYLWVETNCLWSQGNFVIILLAKNYLVVKED